MGSSSAFRLRWGAILAGLLAAVGEAGAAGSLTGGFPRLDSGARGTALSGNLTAAAEGPEAIAWNPAGLLSLERKELAFTYADLFRLGLVTQSAVQFGWPHLRREIRWEDGTIRRVPLPPPAERAFGLYLSSVRADLGEENHYLEVQAGLAYAWRVPLGLRAGAAYRFLHAESDLRGAGARGHAIDLGLQRPLGPFRLGLHAANLASTLRWSGGAESGRTTVDLDAPLAERWSCGLAWSPRHLPLLLTAQGDWSGPSFRANQRGAGAEWRPHPVLVLRGGLRQRKDALGARYEWSAGLGLAAGDLRLDYGLQSSARDLGSTHRWTAGLSL